MVTFSNRAHFTFICTVLVVVGFGLTYAAPLEDFAGNGKEDIVERFVEFLKQDSQLSGAFYREHANLGAHFIRNKRQMENDMEEVENVDTTTLQEAGTEGFFDRAAKFVMEVLQRFLRWINTDKK